MPTKRSVLAQDTVLHGIPCAAGTPIEIDSAGRASLRDGAILARALDVGTISLPAGSAVQFYSPIDGDRALVFTARITAPVTVRDVTLPAGSELELLEDGRLWLATLGAAIEIAIDGPYRARPLRAGAQIVLNEDGWDVLGAAEPLASPTDTRTLAQTEVIAGYELPAGTEITTLDGHLVSARIAQPLVLDGVPCAAGRVGFLRDKLADARLAAPFSRNGLSCRAGTFILLWPDGALSEATLAAPARIEENDIPAGSRAGFYEGSGRLAIVVFAQATKRCAVGQVIELHESGAVRNIGHVSDAEHRNTYRLVGDHVDAALDESD